jgi:hypothetical protein
LGIFLNILFVEMKSSKLNNYLTETQWTMNMLFNYGMCKLWTLNM